MKTPAAQQQRRVGWRENDPALPSQASSFLRAAIMGSAFSFIKLVAENCHWSTAGFTTSSPESDETAIGERRAPPAETGGAGN